MALLTFETNNIKRMLYKNFWRIVHKNMTEAMPRSCMPNYYKAKSFEFYKFRVRNDDCLTTQL